jgi:outer membrane protein OmpU
MKKVLLTTTALVMTAGVAAADVSFSGEAGIAFVDDNGASDAANGTSLVTVCLLSHTMT